jgi:hypothetical protein
VRTDVVDVVAEDVTTALRNRWIPSDEWSTSAPDRENAPQNLESSYSEDSDSFNSVNSLSSAGSVDWDYPDPLPVPVDSPPPAPDGLRLDLGLNTLSHSVLESTDPGLPPPAQNNLRLDLGLNTFSHSILESTDPGLPPPAQNNLPLHIDSNVHPKPNQEPIDGSNFGSNHPTGFEPSSDVKYHWWWFDPSVTWKYPGSSPSPDSNPPPQLGHGNLDENFNLPGLTYDQPPPTPPFDPGTWTRPPLDPGPSTWAHPSLDPGPSTWAHPSLDPGPSTYVHPSLDPGPSKRPDSSVAGSSTLHPPPSPGPQHESEIHFSELFKSSRFKRRISGSCSANAAQRVQEGVVGYP